MCFILGVSLNAGSVNIKKTEDKTLDKINKFDQSILEHKMNFIRIFSLSYIRIIRDTLKENIFYFLISLKFFRKKLLSFNKISFR